MFSLFKPSKADDTCSGVVNPTREASRPRVSPLVDIYETREAIVLVAEMPGVAREDLEILIDREQLTLRGRSSVAAPKDLRQVWGGWGACDYERSFTLGERIDQAAVSAVLRDGLLTVTLPKERASQTRSIAVKAA